MLVTAGLMMLHYVLTAEDLVKDSNFYGWDSLVIINPFLTPRWFQKMDVIPDRFHIEPVKSIYSLHSNPDAESSLGSGVMGPLGSPDRGFSELHMGPFEAVSSWETMYSSFFSGMHGAPWMKGKGSSVGWRVAPRNWVWWHLSRNWSWCIPVWGTEGRLLCYRWLETSSERNSRETCWGKTYRSWLWLQSANGLTLCPLSPPIKWK